MQIINVMASSLDGRIGVHDREGDLERQTSGISGQVDQIFLREQIETADAIIVGASSIRANGECLDHPGRLGKFPSWFIFAQKPLPPTFPFWRQHHIPRYLVTSTPQPIVAESGVVNLVYGDDDPANFLYKYVQEKGHQCALLFGGGIVNQWFYKAQLVDELRLTLAPVLIARAAAPLLVAPELPHTVNFSLIASHVAESFVFLKYTVNRT